MNGRNTLLYNRMENFIQKQQKMSNQVCFWCAIIWEWGVPGHDEISKVQAYGGEILVIPGPIMLWTYFVILQIFFFNIRLYFLLKENSTSMRSLLLFVKTDIHLIQCLLIFFIFYVPDAFQFSVLQNISESVIITIKILSNIKIQKYNFYFSDVWGIWICSPSFETFLIIY